MSVQRYGLFEEGDYPGYSWIEEKSDGDYVLHSDYAALLTRYTALVEAVAWERECNDCDGWICHEIEAELRQLYDTREILLLRDCASYEVDRLLNKGETGHG